MRSLAFTTFLFLILKCSFAQNKHKNIGKQSALTNQYVYSIQTQQTNQPNPKYVFSMLEGKKYVNAFVKISNPEISNEFEKLGILTGTKAGDIWTIKIPINQVAKVTHLNQGIDFIQLDQPIFPTMESARAKTNVNAVHQGLDLPQAYTGKDVIVGIIDVGFDYSHPTFNDTYGETNRIKRVWEQKSTGTPPLGYSYGHEIRDVTNVTFSTDNVEQSHGTHVAGIAAGSGFGGKGSNYKGVAYASDLVFVGITPEQDQWKNTGMTDIIDGINYIYEYADEVGKPAVANLSWGCTVGPHDGTSLFSQAVNNLTGPGKIFTISAGNNGGQSLHLNKVFSDTDSLLKSIVKFSPNLPDKKTWIDIWGEVGETLCMQIGTYTAQTNNNNTNIICIDNTTRDLHLVGSDGDTLFISISTVSEDVNGKPHAFIDLYSKTIDDVSLSVTSTSGEVNAWMGYVYETRGYYGFFTRNGVSGASNGKDDMTIGEMACTESAIAVGAYASKNTYTNVYGLNVSYASYVQPDKICPFSSKGPTADGRHKPDITAPGMTLASALNSLDLSNAPGGSNYERVVHQYTDSDSGHNYYYGEAYGTSMSAPMVAGIVALYLEADPTATPQELIALMNQTAITDDHTSSSPKPDVWGPGKIDAYAMLQSLTLSTIVDVKEKSPTVYPNPTQGLLHLDFDGDKYIEVTNMLGQRCIGIQTPDNTISIGTLPAGIYVISIRANQGRVVMEEMVLKR